MNQTIAMICECPQCGAPEQINSNVCSYCGSEFIIKSLNGLSKLDKVGINKYISAYKKASVNSEDQELNFAMGLCYLKLGVYDFAKKYFETAMADMIENGDIYYYAAIAQFKGKRPFLALLPVIRKAEEYIQAAISLNPESGKYYYLLALIQSDYYDKKCLRSQYTYNELLDEAHRNLATEDELEEILQYIPIPR